ncbi:MAG: hypothetical protein HKN95_05330 [Acidimicrobiia bacterium]|nr:hypothetical protein [Acidimicrobiia bacterium]
MKRILVTVVGVTLVAIGILVFADGTAEVFGFEVVLVVLVLLALTTGRRRPKAPEADFRYRRSRTRHLPPRLLEIEHLVMFSLTSRSDFDHRLLPRLQTLVDDQLMSQRGFGLRDSPERAAEALGEEVWSILRTDRLPVDDVGVPGPSEGELESIVEAIEVLRNLNRSDRIGSRP